MPIELAVKPPRVIPSITLANWKDFFVKLTGCVVKGALQQWDASLLSGLEALKSLGFERTEEELAWRLISRAMMKAVFDLLAESHSRLSPKKKDIKLQLHNDLWQRQLTIGPDFFDYPGQSPIVGDVQEFLYEWFDWCDFAGKPETDAIVRRLPSFFTFALNDEWRKGKPEYKDLTEFFNNPFMQAAVLDEDWTRYHAFLRKQAAETVFGEGFGLEQLYIPLNATVCPSSGEEEGCFRQEKRQEPGIVVDLKTNLLEWLAHGEPDDAVRIVSGWPGSGKSSFAKIFAAQLPEHQKVLFIPLHKIDIGSDVEAAIGKYLKLQDYFRENPLSHADNLLLIFDGLDELTQVGGRYKDAADQLITRVEKQILLQNNGKSRRVCVLYTGRVMVVQSVQDQFSPEQTLTLLPFYVPEKDYEQYTDAGNLLKVDLRDKWWQQYGALTGYSYDGVPDAFRKDRLAEITAQPLLNYLVAISHEPEELKHFKLTNFNEIYARLISRMYRRDWEKKKQLPSIKGIQEDDYWLALEAIAVAAWHGGGRIATVEKILELIDISEFDMKWEAFEKSAEDGAANLLTTFYCKKVEARHAGDKPFEFTHKSFCEYLIVHRIVRLLEFMQEELDSAKSHRLQQKMVEVLDSWRNLCAPVPMDSDLYQFLKDEIALRDKEDVLKWQKMICRLIEYVIAEGMPPADPRPKFKNEDRLSRNAEEALLAAHSACAWRTGEVLPMNWGDEDEEDKIAAGSWLMRLQRQSRGSTFSNTCLNHLDLGNCMFSMGNFYEANLSFTNLDDANLYMATFYGATLRGVSLRRATMNFVLLAYAKLEEALLEEALLFKAHLNFASLKNADFKKVFLEGADFEKAIFDGVNLTDADLKGANLRDAKNLTAEQLLEAKNVDTAQFDPELRAEYECLKVEQKEANSEQEEE